MNYKKTVMISLFLFVFAFSFINENFNKMVATQVETTFVAVASYSREQENVSQYKKVMFPLTSYVMWSEEEARQTEDNGTFEIMLANKKKEEKRTEDTDVQADKVTLEKLKNYDYLLGRYYTVDHTTTVDEMLLNAEEMLAKDVTVNTTEKGPKVLIFHTHSQEAFKDSIKDDTSTTIVGMGKLLANLLNEKGIETLHHDGVYDLVNGKMDRSVAYELSEVAVRKILEENPTIEVVIDLHRDGVGENTHLVENIDGKQTAQIMFFNGLSRTKANGEISYLPNPYIKDNLAFSFQMQLACDEIYPGFARRIYLKGYRYSLHMMPKSLLVEAGAQNNTVDEMRNAMECLANVLCRVLKKTS